MQKALPSSEDPALNEEQNHPLKVLLVDDKQENLFTLEKLLEDDEYRIDFIKCTSGNDALNMALKEDLALILLDVQMPGMDGYEVARFLKANKKTSNIPLIFVTALDHEISYILEGYKKGAVDYLFKPLNPAITRAKVRAFIRSYLQQKELEQKNIMLQNLAMLVNHSINLMCILDVEQLLFQHINPAWQPLLGLPASDLLHTSIRQLQGVSDGFAGLAAAGSDVLMFENSLTAHDGETVWFSWSFVRKNQLWYGNGKDITKNKRIESQLEAANERLEQKVLERTADLLSVNEQLKDEIQKRTHAEDELTHNNEKLLKANQELESFVYMASHDLKAPIANIEALFGILHNKVKDKITEKESRVFKLIDKSIVKFNSILLDLGKIISVQKDLEDEYTEVSLVTALDDVMADIHGIIQESAAEIRSDFEVDHIIYARKHVRSIMYNLLSNAIKYRSPERKPLIEVRSKDEQDYFILSVKDNGLGLNPSQQEKMFAMFKRFHNHVNGSGIGLYLLKKLVDNSGGRIELQSSEGLGSEFRVFIRKTHKRGELVNMN